MNLPFNNQIKSVFKINNKFETFIIYYLIFSLLAHFTYNNISYISSMSLMNYYNDSVMYTIPNIILIITSLVINGLDISNITTVSNLFSLIYSLFYEIQSTIYSLPLIGSYFQYFNWNFTIIFTVILIVYAFIRKLTKFTIKVSILLLVSYILYSSVTNIRLYQFNSTNYESTSFFNSNNSNLVLVDLVKVIDGDTAVFLINGVETKVRLLYIDTPEATSKVEVYGYEAKNFLLQTLVNAKEIRIETDGEEYDKYGRMLAWVWADNILVQESLTRNGYVEDFYDYGDYKYEEIMINSLVYAKDNHLNIYSK